MRLVCPSCSAEYEIDSALVPAPGREVQCSSCSHQWFQPAEAGSPPAPAGPEQMPAAARGTVPEPDEDEETPRPVPHRPVDPGVLAVLRDEALRESEARRGDRPRPPTEAIETAATEDTPPPESRPEAAPDVEAINATLRTISEREHAASVATRTRTHRRRRRRGFRLGFALAVIVAGAAISAYLLAPTAAEDGGWLSGYGRAAVALREAVIGGADRLAEAVRGLVVPGG